MDIWRRAWQGAGSGWQAAAAAVTFSSLSLGGHLGNGKWSHCAWHGSVSCLHFHLSFSLSHFSLSLSLSTLKKHLPGMRKQKGGVGRDPRDLALSGSYLHCTATATHTCCGASSTLLSLWENSMVLLYAKRTPGWDGGGQGMRREGRKEKET